MRLPLENVVKLLAATDLPGLREPVLMEVMRPSSELRVLLAPTQVEHRTRDGGGSAVLGSLSQSHRLGGSGGLCQSFGKGSGFHSKLVSASAWLAGVRRLHVLYVGFSSAPLNNETDRLKPRPFDPVVIGAKR